MNIPLKPVPVETGESCKGLVFAYRASEFINAKGEFVQTQRMVPRKRLSCKGCSQCTYMMDDLQEHIGCGIPILGMDEAKQDELYSLQVVNVTVDWETNVVDGWDLKFVKYIKPEEKPVASDCC